MFTGEPERLYKDDWRCGNKRNQNWVPWIFEIKSYLKPISSYFGSNSTLVRKLVMYCSVSLKITWSIGTLLGKHCYTSQQVLCLWIKELLLGTSTHVSPSLLTSIHSEWVQPTSVECPALKSWLSFLGLTLIHGDNKGSLACLYISFLTFVCVK